MRLDERSTFGCDVFGTEQTYSILRTDIESSNILVGVHGGEKGIGRKGERGGSRCCALIEYAGDVKVGRSHIAVALAIAIISKLLVIMYYGCWLLCFIGTWFVFIITEFYIYFISGF
jgi:hypothetical protein